MSRPNHDIKDSLDLLLDTMCNAFGGIVLIAILVALLSNEVRVTQEATRIRELSTEMTKRRIAQAGSDILAARQYQDDLTNRLEATDLREKIELVKERDRLKDAIESLSKSSIDVQKRTEQAQEAATETTDERVHSLRTQFEELNKQYVTAQNALEAIEQNNQRLRQRISDVESEAQKSKTRNVVQLRLPKEHPQSKVPVPVVIRYNQIYFVYDTSTSRVQRNEYGLTFETMLDGDTEVLPIRGRGVDLSGSTTLLRNVPRQDYYIVCWVYGDSFRVFNQFKQLITRSGYEYGWSPVRPEGFLVLTEQDVTAPPPL